MFESMWMPSRVPRYPGDGVPRGDLSSLLRLPTPPFSTPMASLPGMVNFHGSPTSLACCLRQTS